MAYQVLYRTYRPKRFDECVGQEYIIKTLKNAIKLDKIAHAYLFAGPRGTGKTTIAKLFAKAINCNNFNEESCDTCNSCKAYNDSNNPDIVELDAASNNGVEEIRKMFPQLSRKVYGKDLIYFDNSATAQRPRSVLERWSQISENSNANIHRAVHILASEATDAYEQSRLAVKDFINAESREEVVFTSGTTMSVNMVASSFSEKFISVGDEVIVTEAEHHSNIVPWQLACSRKGAVLKVLKVDDGGRLRIEDLESLISGKTRIMAVTHISNVLGIVNPVREIVEICHRHGVPVLIDGAQGIVHETVDVRDMDCDFYVFSGHKIYAATGTGVMYGKKKWLEQMPPFMGGGEMVAQVKFSGTSYAPLPLKFEAGTQNFASVATFTQALETAKLFRDPEIEASLGETATFLREELEKIDGLKLYGTAGKKAPIFSFSIYGAHHEDLALILDKMGIAVRSGQMCAEPVMDRFGVSGMLRASLAPYNTMQEAEYFVSSLKKAVNMLR